MSESLKLHEPGAMVPIGDVECRVLAVVVRGTSKHVEYHVCWWTAGLRYEEWVASSEIESTGRMKLGFGNGD